MNGKLRRCAFLSLKRRTVFVGGAENEGLEISGADNDRSEMFHVYSRWNAKSTAECLSKS